jgi:phosphatidylserine decarboxylase
VERETGRVCTEEPFGDWIIKHLYSEEREENSLLFRLLGSRWVSELLRWVNYDFPWGPRISGLQDFLDRSRIDLAECVAAPQQLNSARKIFERKIRYWTCRPMNADPRAILSPADARVLVGSLGDTSSLFLKGKFFDLQELLRPDKDRWISAFIAADYVISRLTRKSITTITPRSPAVSWTFTSVRGAIIPATPKLSSLWRHHFPKTRE